MKFLDLDSPFMQGMNKVADLMWLNILTLICCIPVLTVGAAFTALHYMALKIVRNEECYITKDYFKAFGRNFKQGTAIWLIQLFIFLVLIGDFFIMKNSGLEFSNLFRMILMAIGIMVVFTSMFVYPVLAKFDNTVMGTIKNSFFIGVLQFPKTILMIVLFVLPTVLFYLFPQIIPLVFLFGFSAPAWVSALLYNKFFAKLEDQIMEANGGKDTEPLEDDQRIFRDELDKGLIDDQENP